jgi:hypothetical protein
VALALVVTPATLAQQSRPIESRTMVPRDPAEVVLSIEQRVPSCFRCLEFHLEVQGPRTVRFQCLSGCAVPGTQEGKIDEFDFVGLLRVLDEADFFTLPRTVGECVSCPILTVAYRDRGRMQVVVDAGGGNAPSGLRALQRRILTLTNAFNMFKSPTAANYRALLDAGWSPGATVGAGSDDTLLNTAIRGGDPDAVRLLLDRGATITPRVLDDTAESSPKILDLVWKASKAAPESPIAARLLTRAAAAGHGDLVSDLLGRGVPVDTLEPDSGLTPLLSAADLGSTSVVVHLLGKGANVSFKDRSGNNVLWHAAGNDSVLVSMLVKRGLPVDGPNVEGRTPLMHAAESCAANNVRALLEAGADSRLKDKAGKTAFDLIPNDHGPKSDLCLATKSLLGK